MKKLGKTGRLLMDNCSTHCLPTGADPVVWEAAEVRFRGFKLSNGNVVFLPPKTTSWVQPLDQGIIRAFKVIYRKFHVRWILGMLDSQVFQNASQARVDVRAAIEWTRTAWDNFSVGVKIAGSMPRFCLLL